MCQICFTKLVAVMQSSSFWLEMIPSMSLVGQVRQGIKQIIIIIMKGFIATFMLNNTLI